MVAAAENQSWPSAAWPSRIGSGTELAYAEPKAAPVHEMSIFGADGFTFGDLIDIVNPLQHLPIAGSIYRDMTGDEIAAGPKVLGATLFFGPIGLVGSLASLAIEDATGKDIGDHVVAFFRGDQQTDQPGGQPQTVAALADFQPAAGTVATIAEDTVSAWARREADWTARQNTAAPDKTAAVETSPSPDADAFLRGDIAWMPMLLADTQPNIASATEAYRRSTALTMAVAG